VGYAIKTEVGENSARGVDAVQLVEVDQKPEHVFVTILFVETKERIVPDVLLKLKFVTLHLVQLMEVGEHLDGGVHAALLVEKQPKPENEFVTILPLKTEGKNVLELQLKLNIAKCCLVQLHARTFGVSVVS